MVNRNSTSQNLTEIIHNIKYAIAYFSYIPYLFLYIIYIIPIIREKRISYLSSINLQLFVICTINTISFTLPSNREEFQSGPWCYFQAFINTLSDLSKTGILNVCTVGSYLSCTRPDTIDKYFSCYLIVTTLIVWFPPLIFSVIAMFVGDIGNEADFCWIKNNVLLYVYYGVTYVYYIIFYSCLIGLVFEIRSLLEHAKEMKEKVQSYKSRLIINTSIVTIMFVSLCLNTAALICNELGIENKTLVDVLIFATLMETSSNIILALGLGLNTDKISEINKFFCRKKKFQVKTESIEEDSVEIEKLLIQ